MESEIGQNLRKELRDLSEELKLSQTAIAKAVGLSTTAISRWLNHSYDGNVKKIEEAVKRFIDLQHERKTLREKQKAVGYRKPGFVLTSVAKKVLEIATICHTDNLIGVICGDSGLGKTFAVKEFAERNAEVILIEADVGFTAKELFRDLHRRVGLDGMGTIHQLFEDVVQKLRKTGRLIIVDEAEHLPYRALELLRRVYDKAGIGVLLVGMGRLIGNLRGKKGEYAQLYSRVGVYAALEKLRSGDVERIVRESIGEEGNLWKNYLELTGGNTRKLDRLISRSVHIAGLNQGMITPEVIQEAAQTLLI